MNDFMYRKRKGKKDMAPKERDTPKNAVTVMKFRLVGASPPRLPTGSRVSVPIPDSTVKNLEPSHGQDNDRQTYSPLYGGITGTTNAFWGLPIEVDYETHNLLEYCKYKGTVGVSRTHD